MTQHVHTLTGCAPTPLAHYLKGLAVLRLVAEQKDGSARGFWKNDSFHLVSVLDRNELGRFFLEEYEPTPLVAPWNAGSGYYFQEGKTIEKDPSTGKRKKTGVRDQPTAATRAMAALLAGHAFRLEPYRLCAAHGAALVATLGRDHAPKDDDKVGLIARMRAEAPVQALRWLDAVAVVGGGDQGASYPALLGSGGNDGNLDLSSSQIQRLAALMDFETGRPTSAAHPYLQAALFSDSARGLRGETTGQFLPVGVGGPNSASGFAGRSRSNPWDFVLALEGTLLFPVAAVRRLNEALHGAAAPFAFRSLAQGYSSAAVADDGGRGEQWMPLWEHAATPAELDALFREGRMQLGRRPATDAADAARALARVGTARGISRFERFVYAQRNGNSYFAVPAGEWPVPSHGIALPNVNLLDQLDPWLTSLRRAARSNQAPTALTRHLQALDAVVMTLCRENRRGVWAALIEELGAAEDLLVARPRSAVDLRLQPLPRLSPEWIVAANDDSPEFRLALAVASQSAPGDQKRGTDQRLGPIRANCLPLEPPHFRNFNKNAHGLVQDPSVVWQGRDTVTDLAAIVLRRIADGARDGHEGFPLRGVVPARLDDVDAFLTGQIDMRRLGRLARGLMALDWRRTDGIEAATAWAWERVELASSAPLYALFRLLYMEPSRDVVLRPDPAPVRLLVGGRLDDAARVALARLGALGLRPKLRHVVGEEHLAHRLAAAIAFPISSYDRERLLDRIARRTRSDGAVAS